MGSHNNFKILMSLDTLPHDVLYMLLSAAAAKASHSTDLVSFASSSGALREVYVNHKTTLHKLLFQRLLGPHYSPDPGFLDDILPLARYIPLARFTLAFHNLFATSDPDELLDIFDYFYVTPHSPNLLDYLAAIHELDLTGYSYQRRNRACTRNVVELARYWVGRWLAMMALDRWDDGRLRMGVVRPGTCGFVAWLVGVGDGWAERMEEGVKGESVSLAWKEWMETVGTERAREWLAANPEK